MKVTHPKYLVIAVGLMFLAFAIYLARANVHEARQQPRPIPRQITTEQIASWMTIPYISRVYKVPADQLYAAIDHNPSVTPNDSIESIARHENKNAAELVKKIKETVSNAHQ